MKFDYEKYADFNNKYIRQRNSLSAITIQMIDTMFSFINRDKVEKKHIAKAELLGYKYDILSVIISNYNNEVLLKEFELLNNQIYNNENYLPLLIKLQCCAGIYPNDFLIGYAKQIFDDEIYAPIMGDYYNDIYDDNCLILEEQDEENEQEDYEIKHVKQKVY